MKKNTVGLEHEHYVHSTKSFEGDSDKSICKYIHDVPLLSFIKKYSHLLDESLTEEFSRPSSGNLGANPTML